MKVTSYKHVWSESEVDIKLPYYFKDEHIEDDNDYTGQIGYYKVVCGKIWIAEVRKSPFSKDSPHYKGDSYMFGITTIVKSKVDAYNSAYTFTYVLSTDKMRTISAEYLNPKDKISAAEYKKFVKEVKDFLK
jgi:hypothetical protein